MNRTFTAMFGRNGIFAILSLLAIFSSAFGALEQKAKVVSTLLNAKWARTPFILEASEFLATENGEIFWSFVDYFAENDNVDLETRISDEELYKKVIEFTSRYLSPAQIKLLKFELALRAHSPKVEMFRQIAKDRGIYAKNCDAVIEFNGKLFCDIPSEFKVNGELLEVVEVEDDHRFLHFWDDEEQNIPIVILYGKIGCKKFAKMHEELKKLASQGKIKYIMRHFYKNQDEQPMRLSGNYDNFSVSRALVSTKSQWGLKP